jgi:hypothetical protein
MLEKLQQALPCSYGGHESSDGRSQQRWACHEAVLGVHGAPVHVNRHGSVC